MVFCVVRETDGYPHVNILKWFFVNVAAVNIYESVALLNTRLTDDLDVGQIDQVLIESQTPRNIKMKVLSHCLQYHFSNIVGQKNVIFCSPHMKLKICDLACPAAKKFKSNYNRNKFCAVQKCGEILEVLKETDNNTEFSTFFDDCQKKDDLADSLLQILCRMPQFQKDVGKKLSH